MSRNVTFVLMYHRHKLLDLIVIFAFTDHSKSLKSLIYVFIDVKCLRVGR
jgi:hypothetical protein